VLEGSVDRYGRGMAHSFQHWRRHAERLYGCGKVFRERLFTGSVGFLNDRDHGVPSLFGHSDIIPLSLVSWVNRLKFDIFDLSTCL
jgi:hypothetical protein